MASWRYPAALLLLAAAVAGGYYLASNQGPAGGKPAGGGKGGPVPVRVTPAMLADLPVRLALVGRAEASESVTLRARVDGQVMAVAFTAGQQVNQGDLLLRLDAADFEARAKQAEANLARDQALLGRARADQVRYTTAKESVSSERLAEVRAVADAAAATERADEAALELARLQLGYTRIRAPFAGIVGDRLVHPGALVKTSDTDLVRLNRVQPLFVAFAVPERHLPRLRAALATDGLTASVTIPGDGGVPLEGPVTFIDNAVDQSTGTIRLKASLPNQDQRLSPGQFVTIALTLETLRGVVTLPEDALQQGPKGSFVFVVKGDGVEQRKVRLRHAQDGRVAVEGVEAGETVVTDGHVRLTPGAKVQVREKG
jgi:membrane fusion protein, multidrug efflux system